jgi:hypothetical protein
LGIGEQQVLGFFLVLARVSPLFALAPLFSSASIPKRVRGVVAVGIAFGLEPVVARGAVVPVAVAPPPPPPVVPVVGVAVAPQAPSRASRASKSASAATFAGALRRGAR